MGLGDVAPDESGREWVKSDEISELTVGELRARFGEEAVNRALAYMASLSDAEEKYIEAISKGRSKEGYRRNYTRGVTDDESRDGDNDAVERASSKWARRSEEKGIGLD